MSVDDRRKVVHQKGYCYNCLYASHTREWCRSRQTCDVCNKDHHTMLHVDKSIHKRRQQSESTAPSSGEHSRQKQRSQSTRNGRNRRTTAPRHNVQERLSSQTKTHVFMPTAIARVLSSGEPGKTRLLINSGVAQSVILNSFVRRLRLKTTKRDGKEFCTINLQSFHDNSAKVQITGLIREQFNSPLPASTDEKKLQEIYNHISDLADPHYYKPADIEIMVGSDQRNKIMKAGLIQTSSNKPIAESTIFGWMISGACHY